MFCKCYRLWVSHSAPACNGLQTFSFTFPLQHCPREHTHTLEHYKHRFPVSLWKLSPPFPGLLPVITEVTFSKVFFIMQRKVLEIGMVSAVFNGQTVQNIIVKPLSQNYASKNGILESCPCKYIHPLCNKAHTLCQWDLMFKWINQLCLLVFWNIFPYIQRNRWFGGLFLSLGTASVAILGEIWSPPISQLIQTKEMTEKWKREGKGGVKELQEEKVWSILEHMNKSFLPCL